MTAFAPSTFSLPSAFTLTPVTASPSLMSSLASQFIMTGILRSSTAASKPGTMVRPTAEPSVGRWQRLTDMPPVSVMLSNLMPRLSSQSMAPAELSHMNFTSCSSPVLWPPSSVSFANRSLLSSMPCSFWNFVSEAFMPLDE